MITKQEVLGLHLLSEEEQYDWLNKHSVLKIGLNHCTLGICDHDRAETLPEIAFRLREECLDDGLENEWWDCLAEIEEMDIGRTGAIHWIQAALLARIEKENEK